MTDEVKHKAAAAKQDTSAFEHVLHDYGNKRIITLDEDSEAE